ncbi:hypothetical protein ABZ714_22905 [Streptomyces sp. NPDC006798]|uniref:hypothetical protein n=1 Tax=Streptomyces sp. NPDC006798 TaxID=3155462 RepID=UPI0033FD0B5E
MTRAIQTGEVFSPVVAHEARERSDMLDGRVEFWAGGSDLLQADGFVGAESFGAGHDPA